MIYFVGLIAYHLLFHCTLSIFIYSHDSFKNFLLEGKLIDKCHFIDTGSWATSQILISINMQLSINPDTLNMGYAIAV
jgi:hypothetical protein